MVCRVVLLAALLVSGNSLSQVLSVRADSWMPLNGEPGAPRPGFAIEILHRIFSAEQIRLDYQLDSWSRSVRQARNGDIDCIVGAYREEAPELLYPQQPLTHDETAFYVARGSDWRYQGVSSLAGQRVGVIDGYSYGEPLDTWLVSEAGAEAAHATHGRKPLQRNVRMLLAGRLDVLIESPFVMQALVRELDIHDAVVEAGRMDTPPTPVWLACTPVRASSARYLQLFDAGMVRLRSSGELAEIMARYGLEVPAPGGQSPQ